AARGGDADARAEQWLSPLAAGQIATLAWVEAGGAWGPAASRLEARPAGSVYRLSGEKRLVLDGLRAERIFVVANLAQGSGSGTARAGARLGLFAVDAGAAGLSVERQEAFDVTRSLARIRFAEVEARAVGRPGEDGAAIARGLEEATALLCAEMVGGMQRVLEAAVDY